MRFLNARIYGGVCFVLLSLFSLASTALAADNSPTDAANANAPNPAPATTATADEPPTDWIDPATGHRIIRLSREPGTSSLYFHQNAYNERGDKLFVTITNRPAGQESPPTGGLPQFANMTLAVIDLSTLGKSPPKIEKIAEGTARGAVVGKKSGNVYYIRTKFVDGVPESTVVATNMDTHETREIGKLPFRGGSGLAVNADETLLAGSYAVGGGPGGVRGGQTADGSGQGSSGGDAQAKGANGPTENRKAEDRPGAPGDGNEPAPRGGDAGVDSIRRQNGRFASRERGIAARFAARQPMKLFTMDTKTGETNTFHPATDWLNHVQFSTTDPQLLMFCHEGPWHQLDRIWTIKPGTDEAKLMHPRTMPNEIAGHEFFGYDGKTIWYDLQTPRSGQFWLAGVNADTGERIRYPIERSQWSVHYNQSHDGKLFAGDGGGPGSVANRTPLPDNQPLNPPGNGEWIYLFTPKPSETTTMEVGGETVKVGKFEAEKLVDMSKHNYEFEPNLTFTPDNKWIVFRSNMHGPVHTYAVEVAKTN